MTSKKVGTNTRKKIQKPLQMTFTDAGPWAKCELGVLQRIAYALRVWCADQGVAPSSAYGPLAIGWCTDTPLTAATVDNLVGSAYAKHPASQTLANVRTLWALCDRIGVSAEWIFTGTGPKARRTITEGGRLSRSEFAQELAAQVVTACEDIYGAGIAMFCDHEKLLGIITSFVRREAQEDMSYFGLRQKEITDHLRLFFTATKYAELVDEDDVRAPLDRELKVSFGAIREQLLRPTTSSRLPIVQEQFRQLMSRHDELIAKYQIS